MNIYVYHASAFFQEEGLELKAMFHLIYNSLLRGYGYVPSFLGDDMNNQIPNALTMSETHAFLVQDMQNAVDKLDVDLSKAEKRIKQFHQNHERLKQINTEIAKFSIWDFIFHRKGTLKALLKERNEIEEMTISSTELVNIAYYRYLSSTKGNYTDFVTKFREWRDHR